MITKMYIMKVLTNLHIGDGDVNYNIVDKEVERDVVTGLPTINSSGIKGSFRQYLNIENDKDTVIKMFGSEPGQQRDDNKRQGALKFYSGDCLGLAMRNSQGDYPFSLVFTKGMLEMMVEKMEKILNDKSAEPLKSSINDFKSNIDSFKSDKNYYFKNKVSVEGVLINERIKNEDIGTLNKFLDKYIDNFSNKNYVMCSQEFMENYDLPVIARNVLDENKISKNLWYEEFVPHHSVFYTFVSCEDESILNDFNESVANKIIQFGANASIGYGLIELKEVGDFNE